MGKYKEIQEVTGRVCVCGKRKNAESIVNCDTAKQSRGQCSAI